MGVTFAVVGALHLVALALLLSTVFTAGATAVTLGAAAFAYARGAIHALDFDHVSMIDNSTRKFVAEGRRPASVGLAFSAGHSTVVVAVGVLVIAGSGWAVNLLDGGSPAATALGVVGLSASGLYLLLVAITNLATFLTAWRIRRALRVDPDTPVPADALTPRGLSARLMSAPLRRVRYPRHIYLLGFLFGLGFDTASTIGLLMVTTAAAVTGAPPVALLSLPLLFAAAMTLGDTLNSLMMLRMYEDVQTDPARKITYNLVVTGLGVVSALAVAVLAAAALLSDVAGWHNPVVDGLASLDASDAGFALAGLFAVIGGTAFLRWRLAARR